MDAVVQDRPSSPGAATERLPPDRERTAPARRPGRRTPTAVRATVPPLPVEVLLLAASYVGYAVSRALVDQAPAQAVGNGWALLRAERLLGLDVERAAID
jgi:hypothetical protein